MTRAYRCNRCGDMREGYPELALREHEGEPPTDTETTDLCESCKEDYEDFKNGRLHEPDLQ